jgi:hypothetical protein
VAFQVRDAGRQNLEEHPVAQHEETWRREKTAFRHNAMFERD